MIIFKRLIAIICFVSAFFALNSCTKSAKTKNWEIDLTQNSKNPYGLYIAHKEIGNLSKGKVQDLEKLSELNIDPAKAKNYAIVVISDESYFDSITLQNFNNIVKNGGIVLISDYQDNTLDTIYTNNIPPTADFELTTNETFNIQKKKLVEHHYFETFSNDFSIIGTIKYKNKNYPNILKKQPENAKGYYLFHAEPLYFSNYYLLNQDSYFYTKSVLQHLKGRTIIWYNTDKTYASSNTSMMRYILSEKALKYAWYVLLALLFIFLIFRSRREQRIIPIYKQEENHTVEFAKTILSLYQENGEIKDIISKKIDYFLYKIRKIFLIETDDITHKNFIEIVAQKGNFTQEECYKNFEILKNIHQKENPNQHDLKIVYDIIENYKQKANI